MLRATLLIGAFIASANALPQEIKSVKGGHDGRGFQYNATANLVRFYGNNGTQQQSGMRHNLTVPINFEIGVCYIEVPTANLAKDPSHVPAGNGSRPDLSRIRSCCKGYIRNIHNFKICDPVCTQGCMNSLCTAPDTCTCYPDYVKNRAGLCIATCPIGCQNGVCAGGECLCNDGFKLDSESKYCVPVCKGNCGGIGNCVAPNTCECKEGYKTTQEGSCQASCDRCTNGDCVGPNDCRCHAGFHKNPVDGSCQDSCDHCVNGDCVGLNDCRCHQGYQRNQYGECVPQCANGCGNGQCIGPNVCACPEGMESDATGQCVSRCSQSCINGACTGNGVCICNPGYTLDRTDPTGNRCIPSCPGGCPNGVCTAPNLCICNAGFVKDRSIKGRQACVQRTRRSIAQDETDEKPKNVADLLMYMIPDGPEDSLA